MKDQTKKPRGYAADPIMKRIPDDERPVYDPARGPEHLKEVQAKVDELRERYAPKKGN